jgi:hypothetical protein
LGMGLPRRADGAKRQETGDGVPYLGLAYAAGEAN